MTATRTDTGYTVLNAVALKKMAAAAQLAAAAELTEDVVRTTLDELASAGAIVIVGDAALPSDDATALLAAAATPRYA